MNLLELKKGYYVEVVSWENDGDHYKTQTVKAESLEEAMAWKRICDVLFQPDHGRGLGISNVWGEPLENFEDNINKFFDNDPYFGGVKDTEERIWYVEDMRDNLVGYSEEEYSARVSERCTIYNIKEDIKAEVIE